MVLYQPGELSTNNVNGLNEKVCFLLREQYQADTGGDRPAQHCESLTRKTKGFGALFPR